ncbi:MAG: hypothetical protein KAJ40_01795 [Alphaproteobacteria bacterium]|nr:hypothetical protein [Alphaproteobacteria bacterium]
MEEKDSKLSTKDKPKLTGKELRDRSWYMILQTYLDFAPKYIGSKNISNGKKDPVDGVIYTAAGYYRLAEYCNREDEQDSLNGKRLLLHSFSRRQLTGVKKDGQVVPCEDEEKGRDLYGVSARESNVRGNVFREDMHRNILLMEKYFKKDLNLHFDEWEVPISKNGSDGEKETRRVVKFANGQVAIGLFEMEDHTWKCRIYSNLHREGDIRSQFADIDSRPPGILGKLFSTSKEIKDFDNYDEAFDYVCRYWNIAARKLFSGNTKLIDTEGLKGLSLLKAKLADSVLSFFEEKKHRKLGNALFCGVGFAIVSTFLSGAALLGGGLVLGTIIATLYSETTEAVFSYITAPWFKLWDSAELKKQEASRPYDEKDLISEYLVPDENNKRRMCKKLDPKIVQHLHFLDQEEADMNYDDGPLSSPDSPLENFERLLTAPFHIFGAVFDTRYVEDGILVARYPNGLISIMQIDKEKRAVRDYLMYRKSFDEFKDKNAKRAINANLNNLPGKGSVHKFTHEKGKDLRYVSMDEKKFLGDLMTRIGEDKVEDFPALGMNLAELFQTKSDGGIQPKEVPGIPVGDLFKDAAAITQPYALTEDHCQVTLQCE